MQDKDVCAMPVVKSDTFMRLDAAFTDTLVLRFENDPGCEEILAQLKERVVEIMKEAGVQ